MMILNKKNFIYFVLLFFVSVSVFAAIPDVDGFIGGVAEQDGGWLPIIFKYLGDGGRILALIVGALSFLAVSYFTLTKFNACRKGDAEWSELIILLVIAAFLLIFNTLLLNTSEKVMDNRVGGEVLFEELDKQAKEKDEFLGDGVQDEFIGSGIQDKFAGNGTLDGFKGDGSSNKKQFLNDGTPKNDGFLGSGSNTSTSNSTTSTTTSTSTSGGQGSVSDQLKNLEEQRRIIKEQKDKQVKLIDLSIDKQIAELEGNANMGDAAKQLEEKRKELKANLDKEYQGKEKQLDDLESNIKKNEQPKTEDKKESKTDNKTNNNQANSDKGSSKPLTGEEKERLYIITQNRLEQRDKTKVDEINGKIRALNDKINQDYLNQSKELQDNETNYSKKIAELPDSPDKFDRYKELQAEQEKAKQDIQKKYRDQYDKDQAEVDKLRGEYKALFDPVFDEVLDEWNQANTKVRAENPNKVKAIEDNIATINAESATVRQNLKDEQARIRAKYDKLKKDAESNSKDQDELAKKLQELRNQERNESWAANNKYFPELTKLEDKKRFENFQLNSMIKEAAPGLDVKRTVKEKPTNSDQELRIGYYPHKKPNGEIVYVEVYDSENRQEPFIRTIPEWVDKSVKTKNDQLKKALANLSTSGEGTSNFDLSSNTSQGTSQTNNTSKQQESETKIEPRLENNQSKQQENKVDKNSQLTALSDELKADGSKEHKTQNDSNQNQTSSTNSNVQPNNQNITNSEVTTTEDNKVDKQEPALPETTREKLLGFVSYKSESGHNSIYYVYESDDFKGQYTKFNPPMMVDVKRRTKLANTEIRGMIERSQNLKPNTQTTTASSNTKTTNTQLSVKQESPKQQNNTTDLSQDSLSSNESNNNDKKPQVNKKQETNQVANSALEFLGQPQPQQKQEVTDEKQSKDESSQVVDQSLGFLSSPKQSDNQKLNEQKSQTQNDKSTNKETIMVKLIGYTAVENTSIDPNTGKMYGGTVFVNIYESDNFKGKFFKFAEPKMVTIDKKEKEDKLRKELGIIK